jgi:hypothetical protein
MARRINPQTTQRTEPFFIQILQRTGDLIDCRTEPIEQTLAGVCHQDAARRTVQQANPETFL